jgi:hypothetical protein
MPQVELTAEEEALISQARAAKSKAALSDAYDTKAMEETELEIASTPAANPKPATREASKPNHSSYVVRKAREYGISDHDIANMSPAVLEERLHTIDLYQRREQQLAHERQAADAVERIRPRPPEPEAKPVEPDVDITDYLDGETEDKFDPGFLKIIKKQERKRLKDLADLKNDLSQTKQVSQKNEAERLAAQMDEWFAATGRDDEFGKGAFAAVMATPAGRKRQAVYHEMMALGGQNAKNFRMALETLFGKGTPAAVAPAADAVNPYAQRPAAPAARARKAAPAVPTEDDYDEGRLARPTNRRGASEVKGDKQAVSRVAEAMREMGIQDIVDDDGDATDGFLP